MDFLKRNIQKTLRNGNQIITKVTAVSSIGSGNSTLTGNYLPATANEDGTYTVDLTKVTFNGHIVATGEVSAYGAGSGSTPSGGSITVIDNLTSTDANAALSANQGRALKELIDNIDISGLDLSGYYNKTEIDNLLSGHTSNTTVHITETERTNWNDANSKKHTHTNKTVLDNLTQSVIDNSHTHSNKSVLDGITSTKVSNWDSAATNKHTHSNKSVLDGITAAKVTAWDTVVSNWNTAFTIDSNNNLKVKLNLIGEKEVSAYGAGSSSGSGAITIVDALTSSATDAALSANQGRVLKSMIDNIDISSLDTSNFVTKTGSGASGTWGINVSGTATGLAYKTLNGDAVDSTAGTFAFGGNSYSEWSGTDYAGLQVSGLNDKFQISANGGNLVFRQNDTGGSDSTNWNDWKTLAFTTSNVASASKLNTSTSYSVFGQTYWNNGVPQTVANNAIGQMKYLCFRNNANDNNAGYVGAGSTGNNNIALMAYSGNNLLLGADGTTMLTLDGTRTEIKGPSSTPLKLKSNTSSTWMSFYNSSDTLLGFLGIEPANGGLRYSDGSSYWNVLHAGNCNNYVTALSNYYTSRPTSANIQLGNGKLVYFMATSSMTTGKPASDAQIIHCAWDNNGGWDCQIAVRNSGNGIQYRGQNNGTWGNWQSVIFDTGGTMKENLTFNAHSIGVVCTNGTVEQHFQIGSGGTNRGIWDSTANEWTIYKNSNNHTILAATSSLRVGIGTTSPSQKLHVSGNILATGEVTAYSDIRLKKNIKPLQVRGELKPVTYEKDGKKSIGFIAQDVQKIYPELVTEEKTDEKYLSLNYAQLTAVLYAEIIELKRRIKQLENKK